jgi:toxin FitB
MFLVNVLSAAAPTKPMPNPGLAAWMVQNSDLLFLSVIAVAEVQDGISTLRRAGEGEKAAALTEWLATILHLYGRRMLPIDLAVVRMIGIMSDQARGAGLTPGFPDMAIAAAAHAHSLTILTHNIRDFRGFAVAVHDPFNTLPQPRD